LQKKTLQFKTTINDDNRQLHVQEAQRSVAERPRDDSRHKIFR